MDDFTDFEQKLINEFEEVFEKFPGASRRLDEIMDYMLTNDERSPIKAFVELEGPGFQEKFDKHLAQVERGAGYKINREKMLEGMVETGITDLRDFALKLKEDGVLEALKAPEPKAAQNSQELSHQLKDHLEDTGVEDSENSQSEPITKETLIEKLEETLDHKDNKQYGAKGKVFPDSEGLGLEPSEKKDWQVKADEERARVEEKNLEWKEAREKRHNKLQDKVAPFFQDEGLPEGGAVTK